MKTFTEGAISIELQCWEK